MEIKRYGIIHGYAQCRDCNWNAAINTKVNNRMAKLRSAIKTHVTNTGHTVVLETGNSTEYTP